jgi:phosphatidylglycerol---prolipoprotein diacylglyceryl transferase
MGNIFHLYGLIVGVAIVVAISLIEHQYKKLKFPEDYFWKLITSSLIFGIIGARLWHVATDFYLYENNLKEVFYLWNGGLSIFGGVLGGMVGIFLVFQFIINPNLKNNHSNFSINHFLDLAVFGLPVGQIIGRLGNYVNQELYGKPVGDFMKSSAFSVFKVYIKPENRLFGYENIEYYHPLFFYEIIFVAFFVIAIYLFSSKLPKVGKGKIFLIYILYYSLIRFFLDFVRLDKINVEVGGFANIGINQLALVFIFIFASYLFFRKKDVV